MDEKRFGFPTIVEAKNISILDFTYDLPNEKIALHPLPIRDASKLLIYSNGEIKESLFSKIKEQLLPETLLIFNNSKVINARLSFTKSTGARIEIFCLEPLGELKDYQSVMTKQSTVTWDCLIGGVSKWKEPVLTKIISVNNTNVELSVEIERKLANSYAVKFSWLPSNFSFAEILDAAGAVPLPPYIKREVEEVDKDRYQTVFAAHDGSVAAPTAGLHFTNELRAELQEKNIKENFVTLHVGAGTFKPVKADRMEGHDMHSEYIDVQIETIEDLIKYDNVCAVGTTSLRTIETLYWLGVKASISPNLEQLNLTQWEIYNPDLQLKNISKADALNALSGWMKEKQLTRLFTATQLLIVPGYQFKVANILVTNFHQPQSTLLLIVAAAVGKEWKKMYDYALQHEFRFLSFGDSNLIWLENTLTKNN